MIITSLLDTDYYKLTMQQLVFHQFPKAKVEYEFRCRNSDVDLSEFSKTIKREIEQLCKLRFKDDEIDYLKSIGIFQDDYLEFLKDFNLNHTNVDINTNPFRLKIEGKWLDTILFETPILAIISEIYTKRGTIAFPEWFSGYSKLGDKIKLIMNEDIKFAEFGTRRRYSHWFHNEIIKDLLYYCPKQFIGTSNVYFAMKYGINPIGTMAHELLQAGQALTPNGLETSQKFMWFKWLEEYNGKLGIVLTDVINTDAFLRDFGCGFATEYEGCRQDSGDPYDWGNKMIQHYHNLGIDSSKKTAVFSDGLNFEKAIKINDYFAGKLNCVFGIGTNLTNDVGKEPLNIVIKMTRCNGKPVAKISDSPGKSICNDKEYLKMLEEAFELKRSQ